MSEQGRTRMMFQVRFHGRGGQGVVTAAELLASAGNRAQLDAAVGVKSVERFSKTRRFARAGRFPSTRRRWVSGC
jgi:hypothetical protein